MKKPLAKRLLAILLVLVLALSLMPLVSADAGSRIYANLGTVEWWLNDGAVTRAYFFGSSGNAWGEFTLVEGTDYSVNVPDGNWDHIILVRCNPSYTGTDYWSNDCKWNQTGDIALVEGKNYIKSFAENSAEATWDVYGGETPTDPTDPTDPPAEGDFFLVGALNGEDYTGEDYKFVNGSLTAAFTSDSYAAVKNAAGVWYMPMEYCAEPPATLFNTTTTTAGEKLYVPGGKEITFSLTEGEEADTYILSYTVGGDPTPEPGSGRTFDGTEYLYVNGLAQSWWDDYSPLHRLVLKNEAGEETTVVLSFVANLSETERVFGALIPAGTYNTVKVTRSSPDGNTVYNSTGALTIPAEGNYIKEFDQNSTVAVWATYVPGTTPVNPGDHSGANDKVILHCWNWSFDEIREHLPQIKASGYTAVQTSPAQPHSGYREGVIPTGDWWMLYQPLGLKIAQTGESWLGGVNELKALCDAADALGIDVVVDIVSNHICNGYNDIAADGTNPYADSQIIATGTDWQGKTVHGYRFETLPDSRLKNYNPELYDASNPTRYFRDYIFVNDEETENVVRGNIGMPDFKTEDPVVQTAVLNYLKELIDAGVDGFRFDAAKHIETPDDGIYASDFWPAVIGGAEEYAESKGKTVWSYGEVLSTAGKTRRMNSYAPYIDMTEISYAYTITMGVGNHDANGIANQLFKDWLGAVQGDPLNAKDLVLLAESHDMYAQGTDSFSRYNAEVINKAWAVAVARADASTLYFARPQGYSTFHYPDEEDQTSGYPIGTLGKCENFDWMNIEVAEANKFHTAFVGGDEAVSASGSYVVIERWTAEDSGAVLVNVDGTSSNVSAGVSHLADGKYYDQITGAEFTVSGGRASGSMGASGIVVLRKTAPTECEHPANKRYTRTVEPTCTEDGYEAVYCMDCGRMVGEPTILPALGHVDENGDQHCDHCGEFMGCITVYFIDTNDWIPAGDYFNNIRYHAWNAGGGNNGWPGEEMEIVGRTKDDHGIWKAELNPEKYSSLLFNAGEDGSRQTVDLNYVEDAAGNGMVVYTADYNPQGRPFDGSEKLYVNTAAVDWWSSDGAVLLMTLKKTDGSVVCVTLTQQDCAVYGAVIPAGSYVSLVLSRQDPADENNIWNSTGDITIPPQGNYVESFSDGSAAAVWGFWPSGSYDKTNCASGAVLSEICGHTGYRIVDNGKLELWICDCCGQVFKSVYKGSFLFDDVKNQNDYFFIPVYWAYTQDPQITDGVTDNLFGTNQNCTRAQVVTFLWRAFGEPAPTSTSNPFTDVKKGAYYYDAVLWAVEKGITDGMTETTFVPDGTCTRAQVVTFLWRACGKPVPAATANKFTDVKNGDWFYQPVLWAVEKGVTDGTSDTTFSPTVTCIRAQVVTFLFRALKDR